MLPDKKQILKLIAVMGKKLRRAPSLLEFVRSAGIPKYCVLRFFPKWNEAVRAAGLHPRRLWSRPEDSELLKDWGEMVRRKRGLVSRHAYLLKGKYETRTLEKRFGSWERVPDAFRRFAKGQAKWKDVLALLPVVMPEKKAEPAKSKTTPIALARHAQHAMLKGRVTYGNLMNFRGLRHEPVNEQGVVLLFGMLAKELGYLVEATQRGFPDCEAKRQITAGGWQRVSIEFEYESRNFRDHGHPASGCDVIVCWRHNWEECPRNIEVLELSSVIKSLADS